ncbi:MAG: SAF domain-containing protein, partial [Propionibacteriaceae bacterium]|nr:SAF domain-containing protein [Propionibacteriaceae bacterium]
MKTPPAAPITAANLPARRNPRLLAIGVLCVVLGGLGTAFAFLAVTDTIEVLAFARTVPAGQQLSPTDITSVRINATTGLAVVPAERYDEVVGAQVLTDVVAGSLVNPAGVGWVPQPRGTVVVGLRLPYGRLPSTGLRVGDALLLVPLPDERGLNYVMPTADVDLGTATADPV